MAITVPSDLQVIPYGDLLRVEAGREPVETLLENTNWLYAQHRPPIANFCPLNTAAATRQFQVPIMPSVDNLTYELHLNYWAGSGTNYTLEVDTGPDGSSWTNRHTSSEAEGGANAWVAGPPTFTIPNTERYARVTLSGGTASHQLHSCMLMPEALASISSGAKTSGFIPFEDAGIAATGAPIHTEYINRAWSNMRNVLRDRYQVVFSFVQSPAAVHTRFSGSGKELVAYAPYYILGQANPTVTVRIYASDVGSATLWVGQEGYDRVEFTIAGSTRDTDTLTLVGDQGAIEVLCEAGSGLNIYYVVLDWQPGD